MGITPRVGEEVTLKLPGTDHRVVIVGIGLRRAVRGEVPARRVDRGDADRSHQPPPVPAAAVPGRDRHPVGRSDRAGDPRCLAKPQEHRGRDGRGDRLRPGRQAGHGHPPRRAVVVHEYDSLIVGAGAGGSYFGHDEFAEFAPGMKTLADALDQRARIFGAFEMAELEEDPERRAAWLTFVVVGGGPTGVEIAGQIAELARRALKGNFRNFDPKATSGAAVRRRQGDPGDVRRQAVGERPTRSSRTPGSRCTRSRSSRTSTRSASRSRGRTARSTRYAAKTKIWAAGVAASPLAEAAGRREPGPRRPRRADQGAAGLLAARATPRCSRSAT